MENNKSKFGKGFLAGILTAAVIAAVFLTVFAKSLQSGGAGVSYKKGSVVNEELLQKLELLEGTVDASFMGEIDKENLRDGVYKGLIAGLNDPYSVYYNEDEYKKLLEQNEGEYSGIGAVFTQDANSKAVTVVSVYAKQPAAEAGMKPGDILYKVNGKDISGKELEEIVKEIKGKEGTKVSLTMLRGDSRKEVSLSMKRKKIEIPTVSHDMLEDKIGYIRVSEFDLSTTKQYEKALKSLEKKGMKGLVVDLRDNPGGNLATVCEMLDLMLPKGLAVYVEDREGRRSEYETDDEHKFELPVSVLVNGNSASASEIYAGAMQDYGAGKIVGTTTYGKGIVQQVLDLKDGTALKLTYAKYFTPKGRSIHGKGIQPDVEVDLKEELKSRVEISWEEDNQLQKAIEVLKEDMKK